MSLRLQDKNGHDFLADSYGSQQALLYGADGNPIVAKQDAALSDTAYGLPAMGRAFPGKAARIARTDALGTLMAGREVPLIFDPIEGSALNTVVWSALITTQTISVASGLITLNTASTTGSATYSWLLSRRRVLHRTGTPFRFACRGQMRWGVASGAAGTNSGIFAGVADAQNSFTAGTVNNGAMFRISSTGVLQAVMTAGGAERTTTVGTLSSGAISGLGPHSKTWSNASFYHYLITCFDDSCHFQIVDPTDGLLVWEYTFYATSSLTTMWQATHVSAAMGVYNSGIASNASQFFISDVAVNALDADLQLPYYGMQASIGMSAIEVIGAFSQTANYANSAAPASATLSNTASGYATLGGQFQFAAVAGAETDYLLFEYQSLAPYRLYIRRIRISTYNMGAVVATTVTTLQWAIATMTGTTLASGTNMKMALGSQSLAVGAAIGATADKDIDVSLDGFQPIEPGAYLGIILKMPVGTATASQVIRGTIAVDAVWG